MGGLEPASGCCPCIPHCVFSSSLFLGGRRRGCVVLCGFVPQPIALAGNRDDVSVVQEPIQDRRRRGHVTDQLAPVLQWPIRRHHR